MIRLNPHSKSTKRAAIMSQERRTNARDTAVNKKRGIPSTKKSAKK